MARGRLFGSAATLCFLLAIPARTTATPVTVAFSGTVDFSSVGGAPASTFSGTLTWDTLTPGFSPNDPDVKIYRPTPATFVLNGVDYSIDTDISASSIRVTDSGADDFMINVGFFCGDPQLPCNVGSPLRLPGFTSSLVFLHVDVSGPSGMLGSLDPPADLTFLNDATNISSSFFLRSGLDSTTTILSSTTQVEAAVPEPTTIALVSGGAWLAIRRRRKLRLHRLRTSA